MLKVQDLALTKEIKSHLASRQSEIDSLAYEDQVAEADSSWAKKSAKVFDEIRTCLAAVCPGVRRCHYCEDSVADEVEHIYPKKFYPGKTFVSENYLFACGQCNGSFKRDNFAVIQNDGSTVDLIRKKGDPVVAPPAGSPLFLDPRVDDPFSHIEFDPQTGLFIPLDNPGTRDYQRAEYTIKTLGLNRRDYLSRGRRSAYAAYIKSIEEYRSQKLNGAQAGELAVRELEIKDLPHKSVFAEIGRLASAGLLHSHFWIDVPELWSP